MKEWKSGLNLEKNDGRKNWRRVDALYTLKETIWEWMCDKETLVYNIEQ